MNRETLLDDAIAKAKEAEDWQLVEWLRMARGGESAARWYTEKLRELKAENAKLRELVRNALVFITYSGCGIDEPYEGFTTANRFCEDCRHFDTNTCAYVITQDAIELGIEVDE